MAGPPDDTGCRILHVDMDAFYASVELRDRPDLAGQPVIVGATGSRGVVLSATYEARAFGVRSAMPVTRARRLCPQAVFIPPRHHAYARGVQGGHGGLPVGHPRRWSRSRSTRRSSTCPGPSGGSGRPPAIAALIRATIADQQGITCSVGVAPSKFVAKLASTRSKPDGLLVVPADGVLEFLHPLPVAALWGVGEQTGQVLARLGLRTVRDLAQIPVGTLQRELGAVAGRAPGRAGLGPGRAAGRDAARPRRASAPRRRSPATSTTRRSSAASCSGCPGGPRAASARPGPWPGPW